MAPTTVEGPVEVKYAEEEVEGSYCSLCQAEAAPTNRLLLEDGAFKYGLFNDSHIPGATARHATKELARKVREDAVKDFTSLHLGPKSVQRGVDCDRSGGSDIAHCWCLAEQAEAGSEERGGPTTRPDNSVEDAQK